MLTDLQIKRLKPTDARRVVAVGDGLSIRIEPSGRKNWIARKAGRTRGLGIYPEISLAEARSLADAATSAPHQFGALWDQWFADQIAPVHKRPENATNLRPLWASLERRRVDSLKRAELVALLRALRALRARAPSRAIRATSQLRSVLNYAVGLGLIDVSPLYGVPMSVTAGKPKKRTRVLTDGEIDALKEMAEQGGAAGAHGRIAQSCMHTLPSW
ncbi:MAG: Arm DNA-binding domain-containing protein [Rhizobiaceae bacterium]